LARGAYLARAGNCMLCHTDRGGGAAYAGGRPMDTPFGTVYSQQPHARRRAPAWAAGARTSGARCTTGRSRDGRLLYPVFPYTTLHRVTRADVDALFDYLRSLPPVAQANTPHRLRWPFSTQAALAVWRALYFEPGTVARQPAQAAEWNRGAYLVRGLGHCGACHTARNALGASERPCSTCRAA
jgi:mono/diheme cytochrome c family protein